MVALGEERAFLADTTLKLDTSLEERERLLVEVAEAKEKVCKTAAGRIETTPWRKKRLAKPKLCWPRCTRQILLISIFKIAAPRN